MKSQRWYVPTRIAFAFLVGTVIFSPALPGGGGPLVGQDVDPSARAELTAVAPSPFPGAFLHLPLSFEPAPERAGNSTTEFVTRGPGYTVWLSPAAAIVVVGENASRPALDLARVELVGANTSARAEGLDPLPGKSNYFIGNDPKAWRTNVPTFARVRYESVYPGVDLVYYGNPQRLEYDFVLKPGADMKAIRFAVMNGAGKQHGALRISSSGDLVIPTAQGEIRLRKPIVYQEGSEGERQETGFDTEKSRTTSRQSATTHRTFLESRYVLAGAGEVSFHVSGYDHRRPLVIDPTLEYSSFLGGGGWDFGVSAGVATDSAGNLYIASGAASANFPGTSGGYQGGSAGCNLGGGQICGDAFVTKINPSGTAIVYSTYLGGSGADGAYGLAVNGLGHAYVTGPTDSTNFPTTAGAYQTQFGGGTPGCASAGVWPPCGDAFVTRLDPTGSIIYSTYLGGSADDYAEAVAIDGSGNAYVTGQTTSADYPTTPGAFQETSPAANCSPTSLCGTVTVSKLSATGSSLVYSTYVGGSWGSSAAAIAVNTAGEAYVTGGAGAEFPTTPNAYQSDSRAGSDAILVKLDSTGGSLLYASYLGGSIWEWGNGLAVDASGNAYVVGGTFSPDFPVTADAFQTSLDTWIDFHGYVAKVDPSKSGVSSLVFSSLLGGSRTDAVTAVTLDAAGNIYLTGGTNSPDFPTVAPLQGLLAESTGCGGPCGDGFVAKMNPTGSQLLFSTFLGGTANEQFESLALDSAGNIHIGGGTASPNYPTTAGVFQTTFGGGGSDMFVAKISPVPNTPAGTNFAVQPTGSVSLIFDVVTTAGTTAVTESSVGPAPPAGFTLGAPAVYYDISTTATFSGEATVCLTYAGVTFSGVPTLFHYQDGNWVNVTAWVDSVKQIICGRVTSFSPFAVFGAVYLASAQAPISADGTSTFNAQRGSIPVKFTLSIGGEPTCDLVPANISIDRIGTSSGTVLNEDVYSMPSDAGSQFRIDTTACQYVYNVGARSLGPGTYRVDISIYGFVVGSARFALQ